MVRLKPFLSPQYERPQLLCLSAFWFVLGKAPSQVNRLSFHYLIVSLWAEGHNGVLFLLFLEYCCQENFLMDRNSVCVLPNLVTSCHMRAIIKHLKGVSATEKLKF